MNIQEMHSAFRTIGQQMGLQLVRGILPESIDVFLNDVIQEKVQQELSVGTRTAIQETVDTQASTMNTVNILRDLYRTDRIMVLYPVNYSEESIVQGTGGNVGKWDKSKEFEGYGNIDYYNPENGYHEYLIPTKNSVFKLWLYSADQSKWIPVDANGYLDVMMYLGVSLEYPDTKRGSSVPCRMIGADVLETTLRDFCNGASKYSPIVSLISKTIDNKNQAYFQIYTNSKETIFKAINIKYIKKPNKVKFDIDSEKCINCDLPEYCHYEIVERAVQKYKIAIGGQIAEPRNNR